jgi:phosphatidate cytidylyltransferase
MLRTRLLVGGLLIVLTTAMLVFDRAFGPWYPFLFIFFMVLGIIATRELIDLLGPDQAPPRWFAVSSVLIVLAANWPAHVGMQAVDARSLILGAFVLVMLSSFVLGILYFREPGTAVVRLTTATWMTAYLGLLPSFLAQLRWPAEAGGSTEDWPNVAGLALAIFTPKICDIGAFFTGMLIGKHKMAPVLSPGKTWEGVAGGLVAAVAFTLAFVQWWPVLGNSWLHAVGFGLTVGFAGVVGDLAESLVKRDCRRKDASQVVPGFGGVLDVLDSIIFAAPVAYWWLRVAT